jgi:hypothetical protein
MCEGVRVDPGKPGAGSLHAPHHRAMWLANGPALRDDGEKLSDVFTRKSGRRVVV